MMMTKILSAVLVGAVVIAGAGPADAASRKERDCSVQGALMGTIQQARLAGVRKAKLREAVAQAQPGLSEALLDTVPTLGEHVYGIKKRDLKQVDLGAATKAQCLENWDQIQAMRKQLGN